MGKGSDFEREMANRLSIWYSGGKSDDWFWRTQASGGRATVRRKTGRANKEQFGDIVATEEDGKLFTTVFCCECKTGYSKRNKDKKVTNWCALDILDSKQAETVIEKFWKQCSRDAELSDREPLLIFRRPQMTPCICFTSMLYNRLVDFFGPADYSHIRLSIPRVGEQLTIMALADFFDWIPNIRPFLIHWVNS